jgi:RNA 2',3'-cyclic 3'-phosphodiesterase
MRTFVAVFPPLEVRREALSWAKRRSSDDRVRWTRPENVHLTLKFLGDVEAEAFGSIRAALGEVCAQHAPFDAALAELGAFPSARRAKTLWIGAGEGSDRLRSLAADVDDALASLGFEREKRPYVPHLTLGRVRGRPLNLDLPSGAEGNTFRVGRVQLTESRLTAKGATYRTMGDFALGGEALV